MSRQMSCTTPQARRADRTDRWPMIEIVEVADPTAHLNVAVECTSVSTSCWREQNQSSSTRGSPPTCSLAARARTTSKAFWLRCAAHRPDRFPRAVLELRSEERRVGKECRYRWAPS